MHQGKVPGPLLKYRNSLEADINLGPTLRVSIGDPTACFQLAWLLREEKRLTGWKQGHTPEKRFETPAFGGGFFLATLRS